MTKLEQLAEEAIKVVNKMKVLENALKPLEEEYKAYKVKLEREMRLAGNKLIEIPIGKVSRVDKNMKYLDKESLMRKLEVKDLTDYEVTKVVSYIKITPIKE